MSDFAWMNREQLLTTIEALRADLAAERQRREEAEEEETSLTERLDLMTMDWQAEKAAHEATKRELQEWKQYMDGMGPSSHVPRVRLDREQAVTEIIRKERDEARRERDALRKTNHRHLCGCEESAGVFGCSLGCPCRCHGLEAELAEVRRKALEEALSAAVGALCNTPMCDDRMCPARGVTLAIRQLHSAPKEADENV